MLMLRTTAGLFWSMRSRASSVAFLRPPCKVAAVGCSSLDTALALIAAVYEFLARTASRSAVRWFQKGSFSGLTVPIRLTLKSSRVLTLCVFRRRPL